MKGRTIPTDHEDIIYEREDSIMIPAGEDPRIVPFFFYGGVIKGMSAEQEKNPHNSHWRAHCANIVCTVGAASRADQ